MKGILKRTISTLTLIATLAYTMPVFALTETVYTKLNVNGEGYKTIVTTKEGEEAEEKEIEKELPIETKISYKLNGEEISAEEVAGKSGRVTIKIEYENKSEKDVIINGRTQTMYTPFVVVTGAIIDNKSNKNIEVTNGKVIENGNKSIVIGMSLPGLNESLKLSGELADIDLPSTVEISMNTNNFSMKNIITYATPKLLEEDINWNRLNKLFSQANELQNGANKLENGTKELKTGVSQLNNGAKTLSSGATELANGTDELYRTMSSKINELKQLETKYLNKEEIASKITEIVNDNMDTVIDVAIKNTDKAIDAKLEGIKNDGIVLTEEQEKALKEAIKKDIEEVLADVEKNTKELKKNLTDSIIKEIKAEEEIAKKNISNKMEEMKKMTTEEKAKLQKEAEPIIAALVKSGMTKEQATEMVMKFGNTVSENAINDVEKNVLEITTKAINSSIEALQKDNDEAMKNTIEKYKDAIINNISNSLVDGNKEAINKIIKDIEKTIDEKIEKKLQNNNLVKEIKKQIRNELEATIKKVTTETANDIINEVIDKELIKYEPVLNEKIKTINNSLDTLKDALSRINDGAIKLRDGSKELAKGTNKLLAGADTLADGMHEFNSKGINKINKLINGDLYNLKVRGEKLEELSKEYVSFEGENEAENVRFISIVDSIKKNEKNESKEKAIVNNTEKNNKTEE